MKATGILKSALMGMALLLATSAFAANKGPLQVSSPVNVAGKELAAGDYTVQWEGAGPSVELNIMKGKKLVATVPAKVVSLENASTYDSAVVNAEGGSRKLSQIRFSGKKMALEIGEAGGGMSGASSN